MIVNKSLVFSVIISFNPEMANLLKLVRNLNEQCITSVVIDNGTLHESDVNLLSKSCSVIRLDSNVGIAKAQNIGIDFSREHGAEYILFFDQDSEITDSFVDSLLSDYVTVTELSDYKIATIGPVFTDSRYGFFYKFIRLNKFGMRKKINPEYERKPFEVTMIISSGSLIPISVLDDVGNMNETLFIDYVDTEWCLRAVSKGYKLYVATSATMAHTIGDKMVSLLGFNIPVHSPFRRYYRVRNALIFSRMPHIPVLMKVRDNLFNVVHQMILILTQKNKMEYFRSMIRAVKDGIANR
ncbi:glycosyltransferase family 2 protein [Serratia sp. D1N4]